MHYRQTTVERIRQLRLQMLLHSFLYYELNESIISDHEWQRRADELTRLQETNSKPLGCYDAAFNDWDGSTGYHLPKDQWVVSKAHYVLRLHQQTLGTYVEPAAPTARKRIEAAPPIKRRGLFDV